MTRPMTTIIDTWFGPHVEREAYYAFTDKAPPHDPKQCKQLLLRRAMRDVARIQSLQQDRQALQDLVRQGSMGDEMWQQFLDAEAEMNIECEETVLDAEDLTKGWGQNIFREAAQLLEVERQQQQRQALAAEAAARQERDKKRLQRLKEAQALGLSSPTTTATTKRKSKDGTNSPTTPTSDTKVST